MIESILKGFEVWTDAQGIKSKGRAKNIDNISLEGITSLRELILELAIQGKLIRQDPNDEPADELLKRIRIEKERLIEEGNLRAQNELSEVGNEEYPHSIPESWRWVRLGNIGIGSTGKTPNTSISKYFGGEIPFIGPGNISNDGNITQSDKTLTNEGAENSTIADVGDIVMVCIGGSIGKSAIVKFKISFNQQLNCIRPIIFDTKFLSNAFDAPYFQESILKKSTGSATPIINRGKWEEIPVPVPPIEEQKRIVAKVNELMALCDKLEEQQTANLTTHHYLVKSLLETLANVTDADELQAAWDKLSDHFDTLFCTEDSIEQLKQTILQLAIMGRLVKQDPNDEPVKELINQISAEKIRLIEEGKIRDEKPLPEILEEEKPFQIPDTWEWVRLCDIAKLSGGFAYKSSLFIDHGKHQVIRMGNIRPDFLRLDESPVFISEQYGSETSDNKIEQGDILITMTGTKDKKDYLYSLLISPQHINEKILYLNQRLCLVRPILINPEFINAIIKDNRILDSVFVQSTGTANQANIGMTALKNWVLPLPPVKEQERIVEKVYKLFSLCETLKLRILKAGNLKVQLSNAIMQISE